MYKLVPFLALVLSAGCDLPSRPSARKAAPIAPAKITQFYTSTPKLATGDQAQLCYGVENATSVWVFPPRQDLPAALTHCFTVAPSKTIAYRLTAQGADGQNVTQDLTITVGAPRARISEVRVNTLDAKGGETISLCYKVLNTVSVRIDPIGFKGDAAAYRCATDKPKKTTTYVVTATGQDGETDTEKITVTVR